jgi:predicted N-acyltransferase
MPITVIDSLADIDAAEWNHLVPDGYPFALHGFLSTLEEHHCLGERSGWFPRHLIHTDRDGRLSGAVPLYLKDNSFGEFVFDWSWADAYRRHGLEYYPKMVSAIPFTPATGPRLLIRPGADRFAVAGALIESARQLAESLGSSSLHWLFTLPEDQALLQQQGFMSRLGCQFHWYNMDYHDFGEFLAALNAKKRKNIRRERRLIEETSLVIRQLHGNEISETEWMTFHDFYRRTFQQRGNFPALTLPFFQHVGRCLGSRVVLILASRDGIDVAGALSYASDTTLYGRHWGCQADYDSLHFELCYYQGIEYCIRRGLQRFEPGAQGEHKIWRGFLPTLTRSAHWLANPELSAAVADFLRRESLAIKAYARDLDTHSPYRQAS